MKISFKTIIIWFFAFCFLIAGLTTISKGAEFIVSLCIAGALGYWGYATAKKNKINFDAEQNLYSVQHIVIPSLPHNYKASIQQITSAIKMYVDGHMKINSDCDNLLRTTKNPKVYFERKDLLLQKLDELVSIEHAAEITPAPSVLLNSFNNNYTRITNDFLARTWKDTLEKANLLSTDKGKANKLERFFRELAPYQTEMPKKSVEYFQSIKEAYLNDKDTISKVKDLNEL